MRNTHLQTLVSAGKVRAITSSTNASPINLQVTGHGFVTGDKVAVTGHATNTAANGVWTVTRADDNNITLDGSTGNGVGGATGIIYSFIQPIFVKDFRHILASLASDNSAAMTVKCVGSIDKDCPDFDLARSVDNHFEFIQMIDKEDLAAVDGDTGLVLSGTDDFRIFEINTNGLNWLSFIPTAGTAGDITIKVRPFSEK